MKQSPADFSFNNVVTGIGRQEDYKNDLIAALNIKPSGSETIKQLEKLLEKQNGK